MIKVASSSASSHEDICIDSGNSNSGPRVYLAGALPNEPFPQTQTTMPVPKDN